MKEAPIIFTQLCLMTGGWVFGVTAWALAGFPGQIVLLGILLAVLVGIILHRIDRSLTAIHGRMKGLFRLD